MENFNINKFKQNLKTDYIGRNIILFEELDSTNNYALALETRLTHRKAKIISPTAYAYKPKYDSLKKIHKYSLSDLNGMVILAETQTCGRGRFERKWLSPKGGLWFTIILTPDLGERDLPKITIIASTSIVEVFENDYGIETHVKWPNDIYYNKLKLGGILTECEKIQKNPFLNLGIGLNINLDIDELGEYKDKATSTKLITGKEIEREKILVKILYNFEKNYDFYVKTRDFKKIFNKIKEKLIY